ncbi:MAG: VWA domain-containing protein [Spirochaetia bacterium]|nr:VWA domain-containing protein [Spirochaetia bacterium]
MIASGNVFVLFLLLALAAPAGAQTDVRASPVDFVILVDRSKSMDAALEDVKDFLARELVGPAMTTGDRVELLAFYGSTESVWSGRIGSEQDKAALLRSLRGLVPDGAFTDIGAALDAADAALSLLRDSEAPKFVLLLTDERQEAPPGSPYASDDYVVRHPRLEFSRRIDLGSFRAITIGYGLDARLDAAAESLFRLLSEPPTTVSGLLPGAPAGASADGLDGALSVAPAPGSARAGEDVDDGPDSGPADGRSGSPSGAEDGSRTTVGSGRPESSPLPIGALVLATLALGAVVVVAARSRRRGRDRGDAERTR